MCAFEIGDLDTNCQKHLFDLMELALGNGNRGCGVIEASRVNLKLGWLALSSVQKDNALLESGCSCLGKRTVDFNIVGLLDMVLRVQVLKT